jgi:hypothetical protein
MTTAKQVMNSIKPKSKDLFVSTTPKGEIGYDNARDDIEKVKKIRELEVLDINISGNLSDGTNTLTIANAKTAYDHVSDNGTDHSYINQSVKTTDKPTFGSTDSTNFIMGTDAAIDDEGSYNLLIGYHAGYNLDHVASVTGQYNIFMGYQAGAGTTAATKNTGYFNVGIGKDALLKNTSGQSHIAIGYDTLSAATSNYGCVAVGVQALKSTTGTGNVGIGYRAGYSCTTGTYNFNLGFNAGYSNLTGHRNVFIGYQAGYNETTSDKLYIANSNTASPLIYGEFDTPLVKINGNLYINTIKSGANQAAAGAAAGEIWKTASHATLPDNVLMIGV